VTSRILSQISSVRTVFARQEQWKKNDSWRFAYAATAAWRSVRTARFGARAWARLWERLMFYLWKRRVIFAWPAAAFVLQVPWTGA